jgi:hypothetical protein
LSAYTKRKINSRYGKLTEKIDRDLAASPQEGHGREAHETAEGELNRVSSRVNELYQISKA